jgi:primosomal protein N' (replication factor Y)
MKIVRVGLDVPLARLFDYRCDDATAADVGTRVVVPFGRRVVIGVIFEVARAASVPAERLKTVRRVLRGEAALAPEEVRLLRFAADYYQHPLGAVAMSALPAGLRRPIARAAAAAACYALTAAGAAAAADALPVRARVLRALFERFRAQRTLDAAAVRAVAATAPAALKALVARGWVAACAEAPPGSATAPAPSVPPPLTEEQRHAAHEIRSRLGRFQAWLLLGVTGSGKTEVYLDAIAAALDAGRQALLLVPEIALTPQLEATVRARFPATPIASLHSGLAEGERLRHWLAAHAGRARIVLGTRLAVFAPMPELGLIVVDEEHDASFKQPEGFRYSARDLAVFRARDRGVPIVLGSATPSLETYHNAVSGRYRLLTLSRRVHAAPPRIDCIATRDDKLDDGLSRRLIEALAARLERGEQSLVFINRRGYAPVLMCHACGWLSGCHRCSSQLVLHLRDRQLHCHHCGYRSPVPAACPQCGNQDLAPVGQGTQRVESALERRFPSARILRIDRDSTRRKDAWHAMRERIREREVDILVGTQMLAKGHDFPHLNLVGVLNADSLLYSADFRAPERLYALLTQVAGRAGRAGAQGEVLIQTEFPAHPLYAALRDQDYASYARELLAQRRAAGFPPFVHQAVLRAEAPRLDAALACLAQAARLGAALSSRHVTLYEPVPAGMVRLAGRERAQLLVQSASRPALRDFLAAWREMLAASPLSRVRWAIDVDPLEL